MTFLTSELNLCVTPALIYKSLSNFLILSLLFGLTSGKLPDKRTTRHIQLKINNLVHRVIIIRVVKRRCFRTILQD